MKTTRNYLDRILQLALSSFALVVCSSSLTSAQSTPDSLQPGTLGYYLALGQANNPSLRAAESRWEAEKSQAGYAGAPPRLMVEWMEGYKHVETRIGPQQRRIVVKQSFPWFGTLGSSKQAAEFGAQSAQFGFSGVRQDLSVAITDAYWRGAFLARQITLNTETLDLLQTWESVAQTRYENNLATYSDLLDIQIRRASMASEIESLKSRRSVIAQQLAALTGMEDSQDIFYGDPIAPLRNVAATDSVLTKALDDNPALQESESRVLQSSAQKRHASRSNMPSFSLGLDYIQVGEAINPNTPESGRDAVMFTFGVELPIWFGANGARTREASHRVAEAQLASQNVYNQLQAEIARSRFEYTDALRRVDLYEEQLIPQALQEREVSFNDYQVGRVDIQQTLKTAERLLEFQIAFEQACIDTRVAYAKLQALAGSF